jgi:hypothetical protein
MIYLYKSDKISKLFLNFENVKEYNDDIKLNDDDIILIIKYWHIHSIKSIIEKGNYQRGLDNVNVQGKKEYIINQENKDILNNPQSRLLLFNSWETRDLYVKKNKLKKFVIEYLKLPFNRVFFSTANYLNHMNLIKSHILSYDWVYLNEKLRFNREYKLNYNSKKKYRIISLNRRGSYERFYYCCYLFNNLIDKVNFSFINLSCIDFKNYKNYERLNLINDKQWEKFNQNIPKELDSLNPDFYNNNNKTNNISEYLKEAYVQVIFETNGQPINSNTQQISEKSYMGIRNGQPFILFSTTGGILEHLRRLGFKTFHPYINESYDDKNLSYEKRYKLLIKETERLCNISENEIKKIYENMESIIDHNLNLLENKKKIPNILKFIK